MLYSYAVNGLYYIVIVIFNTYMSQNYARFVSVMYLYVHLHMPLVVLRPNIASYFVHLDCMIIPFLSILTVYLLTSLVHSELNYTPFIPNRSALPLLSLELDT